MTAAVSGIKFTSEALHLKLALIEDTYKKVSTMEGDMQAVDKMDARLGRIEASLVTLTKQSS